MSNKKKWESMEQFQVEIDQWLRRAEAAEARVAELEAKNAEWEQKARNWMATPEAAKRLDGYREMAARVAELEEALLEIDKWQTGENNIEDDEDWEADEVLRRRVRAIVKQALAGRKEGA
jgi:hypothetical protein